MRPDDNEKGPLVTYAEDLTGITITDVATIPAEVARQAREYTLIKGKDEDGNAVRFMLATVNVKSACPDHGDMLDDALDGIDFFKLAEVRLRQRGQSLDSRHLQEWGNDEA